MIDGTMKQRFERDSKLFLRRLKVAIIEHIYYLIAYGAFNLNNLKRLYNSSYYYKWQLITFEEFCEEMRVEKLLEKMNGNMNGMMSVKIRRKQWSPLKEKDIGSEQHCGNCLRGQNGKKLCIASMARIREVDRSNGDIRVYVESKCSGEGNWVTLDSLNLVDQIRINKDLGE